MNVKLERLQSFIASVRAAAMSKAASLDVTLATLAALDLGELVQELEGKAAGPVCPFCQRRMLEALTEGEPGLEHSEIVCRGCDVVFLANALEVQQLLGQVRQLQALVAAAYGLAVGAPAAEAVSRIATLLESGTSTPATSEAPGFALGAAPGQQLLALLQRSEWVRVPGLGLVCPICAGSRSRQHRASCWLRQALFLAQHLPTG